ncbi:ATP-binding cassette domain-containing protein, partial [Geotoga petraea]
EEKVEKRYDIGEIKEIKIKDLDFSYGEKEIFNKVNITIKKGEKVAIIGKSGEGKTTFIKLITGNETPEKGETLINDKPTNEIKNIYEKIGVLSQNSHIFNRSIKENITMGREISEEKLNNILHITGVEKFINEKTVGQNGKNLSGGQRVRVALARMMISDPEVVILDEPLEGVDKIREEEVIKNIKKYTKDKTVIIISHRFSILNMAKRIIGIENGKVVLDGEKEEALKNKTILKDFFDAENRMTVMKKGEDVIE